MSKKSKSKRKIPDEYEILTLKFTRKLKKEAKDDIAAFLQVGSVARGKYIKGDSDLDLYLVIKGSKENEVEVLRKINKIKADFESDPQYSSILDFMLFFENELVKEKIDNSNLINWMHVWTGQNGILKIGDKNPFDKLEVKERQLKESAVGMALDNIYMMREGILNAKAGSEEEVAFYGAEGAIGCSQALMYYYDERDFSRYNLPELIPEKLDINLDTKIIIDARDYRLGAKLDDPLAFVERCYDLGWDVVNHLLTEEAK
jgi:predicted nucleotidyltransferase